MPELTKKELQNLLDEGDKILQEHFVDKAADENRQTLDHGSSHSIRVALIALDLIKIYQDIDAVNAIDKKHQELIFYAALMHNFGTTAEGAIDNDASRNLFSKKMKDLGYDENLVTIVAEGMKRTRASKDYLTSSDIETKLEELTSMIVNSANSIDDMRLYEDGIQGFGDYFSDEKSKYQALLSDHQFYQRIALPSGKKYFDPTSNDFYKISIDQKDHDESIDGDLGDGAPKYDTTPDKHNHHKKYSELLYCNHELMQQHKNITGNDPKKQKIKISEAKKELDGFREGLKKHELILQQTKKAIEAKNSGARAQEIEILHQVAGSPIVNHHGTQQDAAEFLTPILEAAYGASPMILTSQLTATEKEDQYKKKDPTLEPLYQIDLQIKEGADSVSQLLENFTQPEDLTEKNFVNFTTADDEREERTKTTKQLSIKLSPSQNEFVVNLKRFNASREKISTPIELDNITIGEKELEATAFILHKGRNSSSGHYVAYVKDENSKWYCYNDSSVTEVSEDGLESVKKEAYIVKYSTKDATLRECSKIGSNNNSNTCWQNAAFAFISSFNTLHDKIEKLPELSGEDEKELKKYKQKLADLKSPKPTPAPTPKTSTTISGTNTRMADREWTAEEVIDDISNSKLFIEKSSFESVATNITKIKSRKSGKDIELAQITPANFSFVASNHHSPKSGSENSKGTYTNINGNWADKLSIAAKTFQPYYAEISKMHICETTSDSQKFFNEDTALFMANFRNCVIEAQSFTQLKPDIIKSMSFSNVIFQKIDFSNCDLTQEDFTKMATHGCVFCSCTFANGIEVEDKTKDTSIVMVKNSPSTSPSGAAAVNVEEKSKEMSL